MSFGELISLLAALAAWITIYWQRRDVRRSERELETRIHDLEQINARITTEQNAREAAIKQEATKRIEMLSVTSAELRDSFSAQHQDHKGLSRGRYILQSNDMFQLSLCLYLLLGHVASISPPMTVEAKERLDAIAAVAAALMNRAQLEFSYTQELFPPDDPIQGGRRLESAETVEARYRPKFAEATAEHARAWEKLTASLSKNTEMKSQ